jgi:hypothetical protein
MTCQDGLQKVAIHAVVIDDKNFDHAQCSAISSMHPGLAQGEPSMAPAP